MVRSGWAVKSGSGQSGFGEFSLVTAVESSWGLMSSVPLRRLCCVKLSWDEVRSVLVRRLSLVVFGWDLICQVTVINFK